MRPPCFKGALVAGERVSRLSCLALSEGGAHEAQLVGTVRAKNLHTPLTLLEGTRRTHHCVDGAGTVQAA
jgi:hypothetical protein